MLLFTHLSEEKIQNITVDQIFNECDILNYQLWSDFELPMNVYVIQKADKKFFAFTEEYIDKIYEDENQKLINPYTKENMPGRKNLLEKRILRPYNLEENKEIIKKLNEEREELQRRLQRMAREKQDQDRDREKRPDPAVLNELSEKIHGLTDRNSLLYKRLGHYSNLRFKDAQTLSSTVENFRGILDEVMNVSSAMSQMNERLSQEKQEFQKERDALLDETKFMRNRVIAASHLHSQNGLLQLEIESLQEKLQESKRDLKKEKKENRRLSSANDENASKIRVAKADLKELKKKIEISDSKWRESTAKISELELERDNLSALLKQKDSSLNSGLAREIHLEGELKILRGAQQPLVERERQIGIEWQIRYEQAQKKHFSEMNAMKVAEIKRVKEYNKQMAILEKERKSISRLFPTVYLTTRWAQVRAGESIHSQQLEQLKPETAVRVVEIRKNRARICSPVKGWVSLVTKNGTLLRKRPKRQKKHREKKILGKSGFKYENGDGVLVEIGGNSFEAIVNFYDEEAKLYEVKWAHYRGYYDVSSKYMKPLKQQLAIMPSADSELNTNDMKIAGVIPFTDDLLIHSSPITPSSFETPSRLHKFSKHATQAKGELGCIRPEYA